MRCKRLFILCGLLVGLTATGGRAQDVVYFANDGSSVANTRLIDAGDDKLTLAVKREEVTRNYTFTRSRIALAFTKTGNYLLTSELDKDPTLARQQIQAFLAAPLRSTAYDFLIQAKPLAVIAVQVAYENEGIVKYVTSAGNTGSISVQELAAILFRDGRHRLIAPVATAAPLLASVRAQLVDPVLASQLPTRSERAQASVLSLQPVVDPDSPVDSAQVTSPVAATVSGMVTDTKPTDELLLAVDERAVYRKRALSQIDAFTTYVGIITDRQVSDSQKDQAIEKGAQLFMPESIIETVSAGRSDPRRYSIRNYLTMLKVMPYRLVRIDWVQTQFVRDLIQNPDGTYSCTIAGQQLFSGHEANGKTNYVDLTPKNVDISLDHYQRPKPEPIKGKWQVLLGSMRVEVD